MNKNGEDGLNALWLIVPLMRQDADKIQPFIKKHQWFLNGGGNVLLKVSGQIDSVIAENLKISGVSLIQMADSSLYEAWNQSMDYLSDIGIGENSYIAFLGLDDELMRNFCSRAAQLAVQSIKFDFIYGNNKGVLNGRYKITISPSTPALFGKDNYIFDVPHPGMMNRWATVRNERFDLKYKLAADFDFYIGIALRNEVVFKYIPTIQAMVGADGVSNRANAKDIYIEEWKAIGLARNVKLNLELQRMEVMRFISRLPFLFELLRRIYWLVTAKKL